MVTVFGGLVLLTLVVLISHLISQAFPLAMTPSLQLEARYNLPNDNYLVASGDVMAGQPLVMKGPGCHLSLVSQTSANTLEKTQTYIRPCEHTLSATSLMGENTIIDISGNGQVRIIPVRALLHGGAIAATQTSQDKHYADTQAPSLASGFSFSVPSNLWQDKEDWHLSLSRRWAVMKISLPTGVFIRWVNRMDPTHIIDKQLSNVDDVMLLPGAKMMLLRRKSELYQLPVDGDGKARFLTELTPSFKADRLDKHIFALQKHRTFFLQEQNEQGTQLSRWVLNAEKGVLGFRPTYRITLANKVSVQEVKEHANANGVAILTDAPSLLLINRVSGEVVAEKELSQPLQGISWFGDRLFGFNQQSLSVWQVQHLSGVTTWASLFQPQHYEGYIEEDVVWQTTSASDFQEAKFSLIPLLIGSIKASLLALFIAIPVALGAAIYTGFFARSRLRHAIKPTIEMLEAVPSVLIGFIAAIWLSPKAEQFLFSFGFFLVVVPFLLIAIALVQRNIATYLPIKMRHGSELIFACLGILLLGYISVEWAPQWLFSLLNIDGYALLSSGSESPIGKTTIVVAIALGLAISPSIYSLAEDAISGVPQDLKHASFALGATRLQTLIYVVLHVAFPGIVAAVMLGFGRAFGETMIVLMVTGNTPVASWGLIEGLRALTANLAIELPEADVSSAHYQILFLTACILFGFTFVVNTVAEIVRRRLRPKGYYG